jgi:hypothetical protein
MAGIEAQGRLVVAVGFVEAPLLAGAEAEQAVDVGVGGRPRDGGHEQHLGRGVVLGRDPLPSLEQLECCRHPVLGFPVDRTGRGGSQRRGDQHGTAQRAREHQRTPDQVASGTTRPARHARDRSAACHPA